jgi:hypothetical protein
VPSAIVRFESNYLVNPAHANFDEIRFGPEQPFHIGPRLLRRK